MTKVLIVPDELRAAATRLREGRDSMARITLRVRSGVPQMPDDLRDHVDATLTRVNLDLTQQRAYMAAEALELERHAYLAERADDPGAPQFTIDELYGFGEPPPLDAHYTPAPVPRAAPPKKKSHKGGGIMGWVHNGLDAAGFIPGLGAVPDVINAGIYGVQGDGENATWSIIGAVPVAGDAAKGAKMARKAAKQALKHGDDVVAAATEARRVDKALSAAREVPKGGLPKKAGPNETLVKRDPQTGKVTNYSVYDEDGLAVKRIDLVGRAHAGVDPPHDPLPTPHVVEYTKHVNPETGEVFMQEDKFARAPNPDELPSP